MQEYQTPFNNAIEISLRILVILKTTYPKKINLEKIVYLDMLNIHYVNKEENIKPLHPNKFNIEWENYIRRKLIQDGIKLLQKKWLIDSVYSDWINYKASENTSAFLDSLSSNYFYNLLEKSKYVSEKFSDISEKELWNIVKNSNIT